MKAVSLIFDSILPDLKLDYYKIIALFRVAVVLIAIIDFSSVYIDLSILISDNSILPWELGLLESEYYVFLEPIYSAILSNGMTVSSFITVLSTLYIVLLVTCGLGFHTKKSFFLAIILQLIIFRTIQSFNYGYDNFITMSFFYCLIFPVSYEFSLDNHRNNKNRGKQYTLTTFLKTHLSIIYFVSGIAKSVDINWWNGNAIWRSVATLDEFIYIDPFFLLVISSLTVILETSYAFIVFSKFKNLRRVLVFHIVLMHLGIALVLGLSSFSSVLIVWNIVAFNKDFSKK